ncbi:hypothetical protein MLD38_033840 [Melastoma candidum]|uniref:Uncharacterized protein n=1 Tax=Melastoma candidum TaxID=119954 RepID=A0ACB9MCD0_9MYRT|nr:hypothetical protein MLD38_033840 [Melastoma candidum]
MDQTHWLGAPPVRGAVYLVLAQYNQRRSSGEIIITSIPNHLKEKLKKTLIRLFVHRTKMEASEILVDMRHQTGEFVVQTRPIKSSKYHRRITGTDNHRNTNTNTENQWLIELAQRSQK